MDRRSFLGLTPVALFPRWTTRPGARGVASGPAKADWWSTVEISGDYKLLASTANADGILIGWRSADSRYEVDFIDSNYPLSEPLSISNTDPNPEFLVDGPVPYRISIFGLDRPSDGSAVILLFDSPAAVSIYVSLRGPKQILALTSESSMRSEG